MKPLMIGLLSLALACCAANRIKASMDPYIGRPVSDLAMRLGPPQNQFEGSGGLVFQWQHFGVQQTSGSAFVVGGVLITNPGQTYQTQCVLSVTARPAKPNPSTAMADWVMSSWQASGTGC